MKKSEAKALLNRLEMHLEEFAEKENLIINFKGGSFDEFTISPKMEIKVKSEGETDFDLRKKEWESKAIFIQAKKEWFGKTIVLSNRAVVRIESIDLKKRKYPIICKSINSSDGYKLAVSQVEALIK